MNKEKWLERVMNESRKLFEELHPKCKEDELVKIVFTTQKEGLRVDANIVKKK
jgi:hypothetical protein|tara:strand:- start:492 stop:650 length:159 start_codon:yes stop_codon:yes gene_type:complete